MPALSPAAALRRLLRRRLASVSVRVDDQAPGWARADAGPTSNERDAYELQEQYRDALTAWRKNPMAKRIVDITTDFCLGDGLTPAAPGSMGAWIERWWAHEKNQMPLRMPELSDELARAGDLFLTFHRNPEDGMSYLRPIPKDRIAHIETLPNDWETEVAYVESRGLEEIVWLSPQHPAAAQAPAIMLHYKVNGVVGALMGESDLATLIPWLQRYSRMLEDRVRLHWALKAFLWTVTVPTNLVQAKAAQYATPPEGGSVVVKDSQETWEAVTPNLHAFDAQYDLWAVRQMLDTGAGMPPHWRGEGTDVNLATATAMERAATRHLRRRQLYLRHMVIDLAHVAYSRAYELGRVRSRPNRAAITCDTTDLSRQDNKDLAQAAASLASAFSTLAGLLSAGATLEPSLRRRMVDLVFRFAGEPLAVGELDAMLAPAPNPPAPPAPQEG